LRSGNELTYRAGSCRLHSALGYRSPEEFEQVTTILFYPGSIEGTTGLRFMGLKDREALGSYRVKIYG